MSQFPVVQNIHNFRKYSENSNIVVNYSQFLQDKNIHYVNRKLHLHTRSLKDSRFVKKQSAIEINKTKYVKNTTTCNKQNLINKSQARRLQNNIKSNLKNKNQNQKTNKKEPSNKKLQTQKQNNESSQLQKILKKQKLKNYRNLLSYNIPRLQQNFKLSRFQLHNLYSFYYTLLFNSKQNINEFKKGIQVMLTMKNLIIRQQVFQNIFKDLKVINFENFVQMLTLIQKQLYNQSIVDYVEILFQNVQCKANIRYDQIVDIIRQRTSSAQAVDITTFIFDQLSKDKLQQTIKLQQISKLCQELQVFSKKLYGLYKKQKKIY